MKKFLALLFILGIGFSAFAQDRPEWVDNALTYGKSKYENLDATGVPQWYYDVGVSNMAASEQRARTRARQDAQATVAANIASDFEQRTDVTGFSEFSDSQIEDFRQLVESAISIAIKTKVPGYEALEWWIEKGNQDNKSYFIAYFLLRMPRKNIIDMIEQADLSKIADTVAASARKEMGITINKEAIRKSLQIAKEETVEAYKEGEE